MQVSVIMPVYNAAPFLERAIQSALEQPQLAELIAIDDASTDDSARILENWAQKTDRLIYLPAISKEPQRAAAARNRGLAVATAPFIAFLDADDYYLPGRFTRTEAYFKAHPEVEGLIEPVEVVYESDLVSQRQRFCKCSCRLNSYEWMLFSYHDLIAPTLQMNGLTLRRAVLDELDNFDPLLTHAQDLDFGRRMVFNGINIKIAGCKMSPIAAYYHHGSNTTNRLQEKWGVSAILEKKWLQLLASEPSTKSHRAQLFYRYVVFKYQSPLWPKWKKALLYPILFSWETIRLIKYLR